MHLLDLHFQKRAYLLCRHEMCPNAALYLSSADMTYSLCNDTFKRQTDRFKTGLILSEILNRA